ELLKVVESTFHIGQGKMPGSVHTKLRNVLKGTFKELRFRPEERLEDTQLERRDMEFLYSDTESATFMDPQPFEQIPVPTQALPPHAIRLNLRVGRRAQARDHSVGGMVFTWSAPASRSLFSISSRELSA